MLTPKLHNAAMMEQKKKTFEGENRSAIVSIANTSVPEMKPNCTALVRSATEPDDNTNALLISGMMALPANHKEVQKN